MPDARAAASMRSASARVPAIGFSHQTCLPASSAAIAISGWNGFGAVIETTSTAGSPTRERQSPVARAKPNSRALRSARSCVASAEHREARALHVAEDGRHGVPGERMALAHVARPDEADAETRSMRRHVTPPRQTVPPSSPDSDLQFLAAGHQVLQLVDLDLGLGVGAERLAAVEHREPVADRVGVADVVGDEDDAQPLAGGPGGCISAPSRSARRRARRSARRGSAPWRRNRPRGRSPRIGARRPTACRPPGADRGCRCRSSASPPRVTAWQWSKST